MPSFRVKVKRTIVETQWVDVDDVPNGQVAGVVAEGLAQMRNKWVPQDDTIIAVVGWRKVHN